MEPLPYSPSHPHPPSAALPRGLLLGDVVAKVNPGISGTVGLVTVWAVVLALQRGAVPEEGVDPSVAEGLRCTVQWVTHRFGLL